MKTTINISGNLQQLRHEALRYNDEIIMPRQSFDYLSHTLLKYMEMQVKCLENIVEDIIPQINKCKQVLELNGEELNSITYLGNLVHLDHRSYESFDHLYVLYKNLNSLFELVINEDPIEEVANMEDDKYWAKKISHVVAE